MHSTVLVAGLFLSVLKINAFKACPVLGPVFPAPTNLTRAVDVQTAFSKLETTLTLAVNQSKTAYGPLSSNDTSFTISVFDSTSDLFSYQFSSPALQQGTQGVKLITEDSIFRIGSLSKLVTLYTFLAEAGFDYWNKPVTQFVPELEQAYKTCSSTKNAIRCVDWDDVTLGALASHMSGITRDYAGFTELLYQDLPFVEDGLPQLPNNTVNCGLSGTDPCTRSQWLAGILSQDAVHAPFTTPAYSNAGFQLLAFAFENITGKSVESMVEQGLFKQLGMTSSYYNAPTNLTNAVLPGGDEASMFSFDYGIESPVGGYLSTQRDLVRMGQSILNNELLSPTETRRWMKPLTFTSSLEQGVGLAWEIWRATNLADHIFDLYTKEGDVPNYSCFLASSPDHNVGFVMLTAGPEASDVLVNVINVIAEGIFPAIEQEARAEAGISFGGAYKAASLQSNITLATAPDTPGLVVTEWFSNGTDMLVVYANVLGAETGVSINLYPTDLLQQSPDGKQKWSFRAAIESLSDRPNGGVFDTSCTTWASVDNFEYGAVGYDEFVFDLEHGNAVAITPSILRTTFART